MKTYPLNKYNCKVVVAVTFVTISFHFSRGLPSWITHYAHSRRIQKLEKSLYFNNKGFDFIKLDFQDDKDYNFARKN